MLKTFSFRLYPNKEQEEMFARHFGCARWVYNWGLALKIKLYEEQKKFISYFDLSKKLTVLKKEEMTSWLADVSAQSLQASLRNLDNAYKGFLGRKKGFPRFKKKGSKQSYQYSQKVRMNWDSREIYLPKVGFVKFRDDRQFNGDPKTTTIVKTPSGKYFVKILVESDASFPQAKTVDAKTTISIKWDSKHFVTLSNGKSIEHPKSLQGSLDKLRSLQKKLSRKTRNSKNWEANRLKIALQHEKIRNQRLDFLHKLAHKLTHDNQVSLIKLITFNVSEMIKNHSTAQALSDFALSTFRRILTYKAQWNGVSIQVFTSGNGEINASGDVDISTSMKEEQFELASQV